MQRLLQDGQRHRVRQGHLTLSEIMTIIVSKRATTSFTLVGTSADFTLSVLIRRV